MAEHALRRLASMKELSHREGLIIVAAVSGVMIGLVILRYLCNIAIDVCILRDMAAARRTIRSCWNCICPCWQLRESDEEGQVNVQANEISNVNSLLLRLTTQEKSLLIGSILTSKVVTAEDLKAWNDTTCTGDIETPEDSDKEATQETMSACSEGAMCSICLHDFELGQHISETKVCGHLFHGDCIKRWLSVNNCAVCCPYCRADIITEADVNRTLQRPAMPADV